MAETKRHIGDVKKKTKCAKEEEEEEAQAEIDIWKYIFGYVEQAVIKCAIELGIAEAIEKHADPMTLSELSSSLGCDPSHLNRIMRFLVHRKIFKVTPTTDGGRGYSQTPLSRRLIKNGKHSLAALILLESSPVMLAPWHSLSAFVMGNDNFSFKMTHGKDLWRYNEANIDHSNVFNQAMACAAKLKMPVVIERCGEAFDGINSLVDVGGGNGTAMSILVNACPWIRAINFDLPHLIAEAPHYDGVQHLPGDMFLSVPIADAASCMWVLHDWPDEECIQILKKCREAIPKENGRVIIVETVIEEEKHDKFTDIGLMMDMVIMAHTNFGKERTLIEWDYVIKMSGFSSYTVKTIHAAGLSVILAFY